MAVDASLRAVVFGVQGLLHYFVGYSEWASNEIVVSGRGVNCYHASYLPQVPDLGGNVYRVCFNERPSYASQAWGRGCQLPYLVWFLR